MKVIHAADVNPCLRNPFNVSQIYQVYDGSDIPDQAQVLLGTGAL
jgi:hypothetical protein